MTEIIWSKFSDHSENKLEILNGSAKKLKIYSVLSKQIDKEIRNTGKGNKY